MLELEELGRLYSRECVKGKPILSTPPQRDNEQQEPSTPTRNNGNNNEPSIPVTPRKSPHDHLFATNSLYLVGKEKGLTFLVARDDLYVSRTCIELVKIGPHKLFIQRRVIYVLDQYSKCVSASLNQDETIMAFTIALRKDDSKNNDNKNNNTNSSNNNNNNNSSSSSSKGGSEVRYESYLVAVERGSRFLFTAMGTQVQRIQFIHDCNNNKKSTSFLFIRDKERIELYNVLAERRGKGVHIMGHPDLQATFVKSHIWMQWDPDQSLLYYLVHKKTDNNTKNYSPFTMRRGSRDEQNYQIWDCSLRCCSFSDPRRPTMLFDYSIPVKFNSTGTGAGLFPTVFGAVPWRNGHTSPDNSTFFQVVTVDNGICFCQQHVIPIKKESSDVTDDPTTNIQQEQHDQFTIQISIYVLHYRTKIDYTIPAEHLSHFEPAMRKQIRVFFGQINSILVVYIPGAHLQFIDVCSEHKPVPLMQFSGSDVRHLLYYNGSVEAALGVQCWNAKYPNIILDLRKGVVCSYDISMPKLDKWYLTPGEKDLVSLIHLIVSHSKDLKKLEQLMSHVSTYQYRSVLATAIEEYLTSATFEIYGQQSGTDKEFLKCVPMSTLERYNPVLHPEFQFYSLHHYEYSHYSGKFVMNVRIPHRHCTSYLLKNTIYMRLQDPKRSTLHDSLAVSSPAESTTPPKPSLKAAFLNFFSGRNQEESKTQPIHEVAETEDYYSQYSKRLFFDNMLDILLAGSNNRDIKQKQRLSKSLNEYTTILTKQTNLLYSRIRQEQYTAQYFRVLECFANALEESCFPVPSGFTTHFAVVAYHTLSRNVFMQYVSRDIVKVNEEVVKHIAKDIFTDSTEKHSSHSLYSTRENESFFSSLLQRLSSVELQASYYEKFLPNSPLMIDHYHQFLGVNSAASFDTLQDAYNQLSQATLQTDITTMTETWENVLPNVSFAPLTFYMLSLTMRTVNNTVPSPQPDTNTPTPSSSLTSTPSFFSFMQAKDDIDQEFDLSDSDSMSEDAMTYDDRYTKFIFQNAAKIMRQSTPLQ